MSFHRKKVFPVFIRIPNQQLHSLSSNKDVLERATKLTWKWGGHAATMWDPYAGKRGRGRPRHRWADILTAGAEKQWPIEINDRNKWKELEKEQLKMLN